MVKTLPGKMLARELLLVIFLILGVVPAARAFAGEPVAAPTAVPQEDAYSAWGYNLWKSVTYETAASVDGFVFGLWFGASATGGLAFGLGSYLLAGTLYYTHEILWNAFGPDPNTSDPVRLGIIKSLSYRVVSTTRVLTTSLLLTGSPLLAGGYAVVNNLIDATVYFVNDLAWARFGPAVTYMGAQPAVAASSGSR